MNLVDMSLYPKIKLVSDWHTSRHLDACVARKCHNATGNTKHSAMHMFRLAVTEVPLKDVRMPSSIRKGISAQKNVAPDVLRKGLS